MLSLLISIAAAQEVGAVLSTQLGVDLAEDRPGEDHTELHSRVRAWARGDTGRDGSWFLEGRGEHHALAGRDVEGWWEPSLGESGWQGELAGPLRLRAGNLIERWGKLDYLPVADVLNPRDLRNGPMTPQEWQRLPIPMAVLQVGTDASKATSLRSETVLIPFAARDKVWMRGTDWSYIREGMVSQEAERVSGWEGGTAALLGDIIATAGASAGDLDPSQRRALDNAVGEKGLPQALVYNGEIAQRVELDAPGVDVAVMAGWMRNRQPLTELDPLLSQLLRQYRLPEIDELDALQRAMAGGPLKTSWPRTGFLGAEAATVVGPIGLRAEGAYWSARTTRLWYGGATTTPVVAVGAAADYVRGSSLQLTTEARYEERLNAPDELLLVAPRDLQLAGGGRLSVASDRFRFQLGGSYSVAFGEWLLLPKVEWRPTSHVRVDVGAVLLDGPWNAPPALPRAYIYEGGPASYFSQNDGLTFGFTWVL